MEVFMAVVNQTYGNHTGVVTDVTINGKKFVMITATSFDAVKEEYYELKDVFWFYIDKEYIGSGKSGMAEFKEKMAQEEEAAKKKKEEEAKKKKEKEENE